MELYTVEIRQKKKDEALNAKRFKKNLLTDSDYVHNFKCMSEFQLSEFLDVHAKKFMEN